MTQFIGATILLLVALVQSGTIQAQSRGSQQPPRVQQPPRARTPAKPQPPLTLRQVIESLSSLRNSSRVETLISTRGVQFEANPAVLDVLKEFGASPKLLSMIPAAPAPPVPVPAAPRVAGTLTVICEPGDCAVIVNDMYKGRTSESRKTVTGLNAGEATVEIFASGYEDVTRKIQLEEGKPLDETFSLKRSSTLRQQSAGASLLKAVTSLGGIDGMADLGDIEGAGTVQWTNAQGQNEEWSMTFNKRVGRDLAITFKTRDGQCSVSMSGQATKQDCKGELKNGGEQIAEQGSSLFLSYQLQDVIQALLKRSLETSDDNENRLETSDGSDSYVLTLGSGSLPADLIYRMNDASAPVQIRYSNYMTLNRGRYPGRIATGRLNSPPVWVFTLSSVRSRAARN